MRRVPLLLLLSAMGMLIARSSAQDQHTWDTAAVGQPGQATTYLADVGGGFCGLPVEIGDYDDDGLVDYAISAMNAWGGPTASRQESGKIVVIRGTGQVGGVIDAANPPAGQPMMTIWGGASFDYAGTELYSADVTGDGKTDLIVGVSGANPNNRVNAGKVFVFPGGANFANATAPIDLASPPSWVIEIKGRDGGDRLGVWVEAGDVNGDGTPDLVLGADQGDGVSNSNTMRGEVYVIFGGQPLPQTIDLLSPPATLLMCVVYGLDNNDHLGTTLHATDLDGDGFAELIAAAAINRAGAANTGIAVAGGDGPGNSRQQCGDTFIFWGRANWPATIDLANPDPFTATNLTKIYGADSNDVLGEELSSGDFDGDGFRDLALGALTSAGWQNASFYAGEAVIIYGGPSLRGQTIDMAAPPANSVIIYGANAFDILADTLSAGDVNADGYEDLLVAIPESDPVKPQGVVADAGEVIVFFGGPVRWPQTILSWAIGDFVPHRRVQGAEAADLQGYSMECGDFNSDGFSEVFPNSMRGDGMQNAYQDAGEVNIVDGRIFSHGLVTLADRPTVGTTFGFNVRATPNDFYYGLFALDTAPGFPIPGQGTVYLANDALLQLSIQPNQPYFLNMVGTLDALGRGQYQMSIPLVPSLAGFVVYTSFVTVDQQANFTAVADTLGFTLLP